LNLCFNIMNVKLCLLNQEIPLKGCIFVICVDIESCVLFVMKWSCEEWILECYMKWSCEEWILECYMKWSCYFKPVAILLVTKDKGMWAIATC
jgi:hypothetical protein